MKEHFLGKKNIERRQIMWLKSIFEISFSGNYILNYAQISSKRWRICFRAYNHKSTKRHVLSVGIIHVTWLVIATKIEHRNRYALTANSCWICSALCAQKLYASNASRGTATMKLSPFVSMKSCRVMDVGSMWCSRKGRRKFCAIRPQIEFVKWTDGQLGGLGVGFRFYRPEMRVVSLIADSSEYDASSGDCIIDASYTCVWVCFVTASVTHIRNVHDLTQISSNSSSTSHTRSHCVRSCVLCAFLASLRAAVVCIILSMCSLHDIIMRQIRSTPTHTPINACRKKSAYLAHHRQLNGSPCVRRPVHETRTKVGGHDAAQRRSDDHADALAPEVPHDQHQIDGHQDQAQPHADHLLDALTCAEDMRKPSSSMYRRDRDRQQQQYSSTFTPRSREFELYLNIVLCRDWQVRTTSGRRAKGSGW